MKIEWTEAERHQLENTFSFHLQQHEQQQQTKEKLTKDKKRPTTAVNRKER